MNRLLIASILLVPATAVEAQQLTFEHDGLNRQYRIHIPDGLSESPAVVFGLHGYGGGNNDMISNYGWRELANEEKFIFVAPNGTRDNSNRRFWDVDYDFHPQFDIDDDGFLSSLAIHLQDTLGADPERTFVTGFSNGAEMVLQLACRESETFTGFGSVIGMMLEPLFNDCNPTVKRPILAMNGTADGITLYGGDLGNSGGWGPYGSIPNLISFWVDLVETPILDRSFIENSSANDGSTVRLDSHTAKNHPREVRFYSINGGGHDWPGRSGNMDIDATREVWDFFASIEPEIPFVPADLNQDGVVNSADLGIMLSQWGRGPSATDLNDDNVVNSGDIGLLLSAWTG